MIHNLLNNISALKKERTCFEPNKEKALVRPALTGAVDVPSFEAFIRIVVFLFPHSNWWTSLEDLRIAHPLLPVEEIINNLKDEQPIKSLAQLQKVKQFLE